MISFLLLAACPLLALGQSCVPAVTEVNGQKVACKSDVVFQENFDSLDSSRWTNTVSISGDDYDFVVFDKDSENFFIEDGKLVVKPTLYNETFVRRGSLTLEGCTSSKETACSMKASSYSIIPPVKSAQLCTNSSFRFKYGKITVRARLPSGDWLLPQVWLVPALGEYGAGYRSGKVRLASCRGNKDLVAPTGGQIGATVLQAGILLAHNSEEVPIRSRTAQFESSEPWTDRHHDYTFEWTPDKLRFYVDGRVDKASDVYSNDQFESLVESVGFDKTLNLLWGIGTRLAPFDKEFFICLGVSAGGGRGFPDGSRSSGKTKPWQNLRTKSLLNFWKALPEWLPTWREARLEVDSVTVTAL